jgi:alanine-glyoxylate transaminase/(R)-3-amino-2-methylpropionate-pyruvate transaminase
LLQRLAKLQDELPDVIVDVRGKGLFIGMEMVTDKVKGKIEDMLNIFLYQ